MPRDDLAVPGLLSRIREQPREVLDAIAKSMNVRASEPAMQAICARYMAQIALPKGARVLEVGCGNGAATKLIMQHVNPAQLVGIDPSPVFIEIRKVLRERLHIAQDDWERLEVIWGDRLWENLLTIGRQRTPILLSPFAQRAV